MVWEGRLDICSRACTIRAPERAVVSGPPGLGPTMVLASPNPAEIVAGRAAYASSIRPVLEVVRMRVSRETTSKEAARELPELTALAASPPGDCDPELA